MQLSRVQHAAFTPSVKGPTLLQSQSGSSVSCALRQSKVRGAKELLEAAATAFATAHAVRTRGAMPA